MMTEFLKFLRAKRTRWALLPTVIVMMLPGGPYDTDPVVIVHKP